MDTSPADPGSSSDPRHLDGRSFGGTLDLSQNWLFHAGDDPSFASPQLDDSAWIAVSTHKPLFDYGFRNIVFCWYRLHVRVLPSSRNIAIGLASVSGAYEVFVNGNKIGDSGRMVPQVYSHQGGLLTFPVPDTLVASTHGELVIALRVVADRTGEQGRGSASPINEDSTLLLESATSARYHSSYLAAHRGIGYLISAALALLVGYVSLALFLALRTQFEYLAIALFLLFYAAINILRIATFFGTYTFTTNLVV